jgi:hypothetical protein
VDRRTLQCPSARPEMPGSRVLGVIREVDGQAFLHHLADPVAVTPAVLALAGDAPLSEVFRFTAPCAASACSHFDGHDCRLAAKIVEAVPYRATSLPPCSLRRDCRWHAQEGMAACLVCPLLLSETADPSPELAYAANPRL